MLYLLSLLAITARSTVPEVSPIEETPAPQLKCPEGCTTFFDGCNTCGCDEEGNLMSCSRMFCTDRGEPKCIAYKEDKDDTSPIRRCPRGCTSWYDGCNDCSCAAPGKLGVCTLRMCVTKAEEKCTNWEEREDDSCPADCDSFYDGCNTCKCVGGIKVGCTRKMCARKEEPKCLDGTGGEADEACPADCSSFFDGCNTCKCVNGKKVGCTKKACLRKGEPKCIDADLPIEGDEGGEGDEGADSVMCPADCVTFFDGCNTCKCANGKKGACTKKLCFEKKDPKCLDGEVPEPEPKKCPEDCSTWFDGCNTCRCRGSGEAPMCTRKQCLTYEEPKCMDESDISDIIRMSFNELRKFCYNNRENSAECVKACGKAKKGVCKGYKSERKVKCKKIKDMGFCALLGCDASAKKCRGKPDFAA